MAALFDCASRVAFKSWHKSLALMRADEFRVERVVQFPRQHLFQFGSHGNPLVSVEWVALHFRSTGRPRRDLWSGKGRDTRAQQRDGPPRALPQNPSPCGRRISSWRAIEAEIGIALGQRPRKIGYAAQHAGVGRSTVYEWLERGRAGEATSRIPSRCDCIPQVIQSSRRYTMTKTDMIRVRIEPKLKAQAEKVLEEIGLKPSDAIRILYKRIVRQNGLPLELMDFNAETLQAVEDDKKGKMTRYKNTDEMFKKLGRDACPPTEARRKERFDEVQLSNAISSGSRNVAKT